MRWFITALMILINSLISSTFLQNIAVFGIKPNTELIIIISIAFIRGAGEGAVTGFMAGFVRDSLFGRCIGVYSFAGFLLGFICGEMFSSFYKESIIIPVVISFLSVFCYETLIYCCTALLDGNTDIVYCFVRIMLPEALYTAFLTVFLYKIIYLINEKLERRESGRMKFFQKR